MVDRDQDRTDNREPLTVRKGAHPLFWLLILVALLLLAWSWYNQRAGQTPSLGRVDTTSTPAHPPPLPRK